MKVSQRDEAYRKQWVKPRWRMYIEWWIILKPMQRWMGVDSGLYRNQLLDTSTARYWIELGGRRTYQNKRQRSVYGYLLLIEVAESDIATTSPAFVTQDTWTRQKRRHKRHQRDGDDETSTLSTHNKIILEYLPASSLYWTRLITSSKFWRKRRARDRFGHRVQRIGRAVVHHSGGSIPPA